MTEKTEDRNEIENLEKGEAVILTGFAKIIKDIREEKKLSEASPLKFRIKGEHEKEVELVLNKYKSFIPVNTIIAESNDNDFENEIVVSVLFGSKCVDIEIDTKPDKYKKNFANNLIGLKKTTNFLDKIYDQFKELIGVYNAWPDVDQLMSFSQYIELLGTKSCINFISDIAETMEKFLTTIEKRLPFDPKLVKIMSYLHNITDQYNKEKFIYNKPMTLRQYIKEKAPEELDYLDSMLNEINRNTENNQK